MLSSCLAYYAHWGCFQATQIAMASLSSVNASCKLGRRKEEKLQNGVAIVPAKATYQIAQLFLFHVLENFAD